jgi:hypothetical protein
MAAISFYSITKGNKRTLNEKRILSGDGEDLVVFAACSKERNAST